MVLGSLVEVECEFINKITNKRDTSLSVEVDSSCVPFSIQSHSQDLVLLDLDFFEMAFSTVVENLASVCHDRSDDGSVDGNFVVRTNGVVLFEETE